MLQRKELQGASMHPPRCSQARAPHTTPSRLPRLQGVYTLARSRASTVVGDSQQADADLAQALTYLKEARVRTPNCGSITRRARRPIYKNCNGMCP